MKRGNEKLQVTASLATIRRSDMSSLSISHTFPNRRPATGARLAMLSLCTLLTVLGWTGRALAQQTSANKGQGRTQVSKSSTAPSTVPTLLIRSDTVCTYSIDDEESQPLSADKVKKVNTTIGEHLVEAVSVDGKDHWKAVIELDKSSQKVVLIELNKVRVAREAAEQEATRLAEEAKQKEASVQEAAAAQKKLEEEQEAKQKEREEITDKIDALQQQADKEEDEARNDENNALGSDRDAQVANSNGGFFGKIASAAHSGSADKARESAKQHRQKAEELKREIVALQRKLQRLDSETSVSIPPATSDRQPAAPDANAPTRLQQQQKAADET